MGEAGGKDLSEVAAGFYTLLDITRALEQVASSEFYAKNIINDIAKNENTRENIEERLGKIGNLDLLFREIAELFYDHSRGAAAEATKIAAAATVIIDVFTKNILVRTDAQLRRFRKRNTKIYRTRRVPSDVKNEIDRAFFYLEQIKKEFSTHEWDTMLKAKIIIDQTEYSKKREC